MSNTKLDVAGSSVPLKTCNAVGALNGAPFIAYTLPVCVTVGRDAGTPVKSPQAAPATAMVNAARATVVGFDLRIRRVMFGEFKGEGYDAWYDCSSDWCRLTSTIRSSSFATTLQGSPKLAEYTGSGRDHPAP